MRITLRVYASNEGQNPTKRVLPPSASWHVFLEVFRNAVELQVNSSRFFCHPQHDIARDGGKGVEMSFPAWIYTYIYIYTLISCHIFGIYIHWDILCRPVHCLKNKRFTHDNYQFWGSMISFREYISIYLHNIPRNLKSNLTWNGNSTNYVCDTVFTNKNTGGHC